MFLSATTDRWVNTLFADSAKASLARQLEFDYDSSGFQFICKSKKVFILFRVSEWKRATLTRVMLTNLKNSDVYTHRLWINFAKSKLSRKHTENFELKNAKVNCSWPLIGTGTVVWITCDIEGEDCSRERFDWNGILYSHHVQSVNGELLSVTYWVDSEVQQFLSKSMYFNER